MMSNPKLSPCQYCKCTDIEIIGKKFYRVICCTCGTTIPNSTMIYLPKNVSQERAIDLWNWSCRLKPCPFCGSRHVYMGDNARGKFPYYALCGGCGARSVLCDAPETVEEMWNMRNGVRDDE